MNKKNIILFSFTILLCSFIPMSLSAEDNGRSTIAVYQLKAADVSEGMVVILSDVMRDAIFQTGKYRMLTKEDTKQILDNIADRQRIQPDCDSTACLLEIAGALGVEKMITGNIGKLGDTYVINLRLVDTELADTKNTLSETCLCKEDMLINKIRQAGLKLLGEKVVSAVSSPATLTRTTMGSQPTTNQARNVTQTDLGEMVFVPGGTFEMGDTFGGGDSDEKPVHQVTLDNFFIDKYEVTQREYRQVMEENPSHFKNCNDCPVEKVTWHNAKDYCEKVGKRLPTEAEWEYAARSGGKKEKWSGTNSNVGNYAWYNNSGNKTHPVGQKQPNGLGIYDMSGNVWEWVSDWEGSYSSNSQNNPKGPSNGTYRVLRGGSWYNSESFTRSAARDWFEPDSRYFGIGFRCARTE